MSRNRSRHNKMSHTVHKTTNDEPLSESIFRRLNLRIILLGIGVVVAFLTILFLSISIPNDNGKIVTEKSDPNHAWNKEKKSWKTKRLEKGDLKTIVNRISSKQIMKTILPNILKVRTPGTPGIDEVKRYIVSTMTNLNWDVELDSFEERIPNGTMIPFHNIIATLNPYARRRLVLACHYDSKIEPAGFLAATDSACPCSMMIEIARVLTPILNSQTPKESRDLTLQLIFFDGEEAIEEWTASDSLYGSRHLANVWHEQRWPRNGQDTFKIHSIDLLVLLDLLGEAKPHFKNSYNVRSKYFPELEDIEKRVRGKSEYFSGSKNLYRINIDDDHMPFHRMDVPVTHLIPVPFPPSWHKLEDNGDNLDEKTIKALTDIIAVFVCEYLHLSKIK